MESRDNNAVNDTSQSHVLPGQGFDDLSNGITDSAAGNSGYPGRIRKPPAHLSEYVTGNDFENELAMCSVDYCYMIVAAFLQNYSEAIQ